MNCWRDACFIHQPLLCATRGEEDQASRKRASERVQRWKEETISLTGRPSETDRQTDGLLMVAEWTVHRDT